MLGITPISKLPWIDLIDQLQLPELLELPLGPSEWAAHLGAQLDEAPCATAPRV